LHRIATLAHERTGRELDAAREHLQSALTAHCEACGGKGLIYVQGDEDGGYDDAPDAIVTCPDCKA
jgi:hypothetical protein